MSAKAQRLRVTYARGAQLQYVSHLDMMRFWERVLRRSHLPVSYSDGFTPHAQIAMGAPLSVGMTGRAELIDIFLAQPLLPAEFRAALEPQLPIGMRVEDVVEISLLGPSLQSQLRASECEIVLRSEANAAEVEEKVAALLAAESFPWEHKRDKETRRYDLRPLVLDLKLHRRAGCSVLVARLRADESGTGRPDQLVAALGLTEAVAQIERTALVLATSTVQNE